MDRDTYRILLLVGVMLGAAGSGFAASIAIDTGYDNPADTSDGVPLGAPNGLYVTVEGNTSIGLEQFINGSDTVVIVTDDGNATIQASGNADVAIAASEITGTWTNATDINASLNPVTIDPEDKTPATAGGGIERLSYKDASAVAADDGQADFYYGGSSGQSRVTIEGAPADTQLGAVDAQSGALLDIATSDANGQITFDQLDNSNHTVLLQTSESASFGSPSPTGDLDADPSQISVNVSDADFDSGDTATVTITLDGTQIHSETISSDSTVTTAIPTNGTTGGEHTWTVEATDSYGNTRTETYNYRVPDILNIRNETAPSQLISSPVTVDVSFFTNTGVVTRSTSNGTLNLTGLPVGGEFIVSADASDSDYTSRTAFIQSIYQQQNIYLLNTNTTETIDARFELEDPTGQFSSSTVIFVEKPINRSGSTTYQTVAADEFGAEGVTATLQKGQRYRLRVQNDQGTSQIIGPYRAEVSETVTVRPGTPTIGIGELTDGWGANADLTNDTLSYRYSDPNQETDQVKVTIYRRGDPDDLLVSNETFFDVGNVSNQITLNKTQKKQSWVVRFEADRNADTNVKEIVVSNRPDVLPDIASEWRVITGVLLLLLSAGAFSLLNAKVGALVVATEGGLLWWIGWLEGVTTGVLVVLAMFVAVIVNLYDRR